MTKKIKDKDLDKISGGMNEFQNTTGGGAGGSGQDPILHPGEPGGTPGVHKDDQGGGIGDEGSGTFDKDNG